MDPKDLWIGEQLMSTKSGKVGRYEGPHSDGKRLRVKVGEKYILMHPQHVVIYEEKRSLEIKEKSEKKYETKDNFGDILDLHIEKLNPSMEHAEPSHILDYQIRQCRSFVESCIRKYKLSAIIIHGKGNGQLRHEVKHLLGDYSEVKFIQEIHQGGAQKLDFLYY